MAGLPAAPGGAVAIAAALLLAAALPVSGQGARAGTDTRWAEQVPPPDLLIEFARGESELRNVGRAYSQGRTAMRRRVADLPEAERRAEEQRWFESWQRELESLDFDALSLEGKIDYLVLRNELEIDMDADPPPGGGVGPIGDENLRIHLRRSWIPYTPAELLAIAEEEIVWMDAALRDAARRMGFGDDWRAAQEKVKEAYVAPGDKPGLIRDIAYDSEAWLERTGSITVPPHMREIWRMNMRGPEGQLTNPFFTGGLTITISYPTDDMSHDQKLMSARGNNPHFNRATVHHELIPGHGLQSWMTSRFNSHRNSGGPFWGEGWALYYEFVLWDQGFPRGPEDEIGMLTWRMHRAARIVFSLNYHLGRWTPEECVDYLVDRVGFDRANSEAEVRRSMGAAPLYQLAYMMGGLQFYSLRKEFVDSGKMTEREFHDTIMQGGRLPVELVRLRLLGDGLTRDYTTQWRFYGDPLSDG